MRLPFQTTSRDRDDLHDSLKAENNLTGEEIRQRLITKVREAGMVWKAERNVRGVNEHPFDLAVGNEDTREMCGIEIKGDTDNFSRLRVQAEAYLFAFSEVYLAVHKKPEPDWLPHTVGILYVTEDGTVYLIRPCSVFRRPLDISTEFEWDAILRANGLGTGHKRIRSTLNVVWEVRNNILFNRFFAKMDPDERGKFEKFYPLSENQIETVMGLDVDHFRKVIEADLTGLEKRFKALKRLVAYAKDEYEEAQKQLDFLEKGV